MGVSYTPGDVNGMPDFPRAAQHDPSGYLKGSNDFALVEGAQPGATATVRHDVTTSPNATQDLIIHQTPTCQTFE